MAKRINREIDVEAGTVTFTDVNTNQNVVCAIDDIPTETQRHLLLHGLNAKVGDAAASPDVDAIAVMTGVYSALKEGTWSTRSGGGGPRVTQIARALEKATGRSLEEVVEMLEGMDDDKKKALRKHPKVKQALAEIKREDEARKAKQLEAEAEAAPDLAELLA